MARETTFIGKKLTWWADKGFWAVADQGLFAVSNFVFNVLLVRWLDPSGYGAFTLVYSIFLLAGTFHSALFSEPMLVFGSGRYVNRFAAYLRALMRDHWIVTIAVGAVFAIAGLITHALGHDELTPALLGLGFSSPFILFQWLMRRACYVRLQPRLAAIAGAIYMAVVFGGAWAMFRLDWFSSASALAVMGAASLISGLWLAVILSGRQPVEVDDGLARDLIHHHWRYGRWSAATAALTWVPSNIYYVVLPATAGLAASASLRALYNLIMPILHLNSAFGSIVLPSLVRARVQGGFNRLLALAATLMVGGALLYWILIGLFGRDVLSWLYGDQYTTFAPLVWILGAAPPVAALGAILGDALRAYERPDRVFWAYGASTAVALTAGLALLILYGVTGAAIALVLSFVTTAGVLAAFVRQHNRARTTESLARESRLE